MLKVILVYAPPHNTYSGSSFVSHPPLGLLYLATFLKSNAENMDLDVKILDGLVTGFNNCLEFITRYNPDIVGISFTTFEAIGAYQLINSIRNLLKNDVAIVCGGPHPSALPQEVLSRAKVDAVFVGEGELSFLKFVAKVCEDGIEWLRKSDNKIIQPLPIKNINEIPFPDRKLINLKSYVGSTLQVAPPEVSIITTRGCYWRSCTFCSNPVWVNMRVRSPANVASEIELLINDFGFHEIYDVADALVPNIRWIEKFYKEIRERRLDFAWKTSLRGDLISEEFVKLLAKTGCWLVSLGIESGNPKTLRGINKGVSLDRIERLLKILKKYNIKTRGFFMIFNFWEENGQLFFEGMEEVRRTIKYIRYLMKKGLLDFPSISVFTPLPASEAFETALRHKLIPEELLGKWNEWTYEYPIVKLPDKSHVLWNKFRRELSIIQLVSLIRNAHLINPRVRPKLVRSLFRLV